MSDRWRNHFFLPPGSERGSDLQTWADFLREILAAFLWTAGAVLIVLVGWLIFAT